MFFIRVGLYPLHISNLKFQTGQARVLSQNFVMVRQGKDEADGLISAG